MFTVITTAPSDSNDDVLGCVGLVGCTLWSVSLTEGGIWGGHTLTVLFTGFPLDKAVSYAKLRNPLLINDLNMQYYIQDRYGTQHLSTQFSLPDGYSAETMQHSFEEKTLRIYASVPWFLNDTEVS